jgi:hypothetical protein
VNHIMCSLSHEFRGVPDPDLSTKSRFRFLAMKSSESRFGPTGFHLFGLDSDQFCVDLHGHHPLSISTNTIYGV